MEVMAKSTNVRTTPRKLRLVADVVREMEVIKAELVLENLHRGAAKLLLNVLRQAIGNAVNNFKLKKENLIIKSLMVNEGLHLKRWRFASRGAVHPVIKRTSHITLVLGEKDGTKS